MNDALDIDELCTPAMFNSITAFLAKNEITAQVDVGTVSNEQQDRLRALQERRKMKLASISPIRKEA